jgi:hypothetical protein
VVRALVDQLLGRKPHISPWEREAEEARTAEVNAAAACLMDEPKQVGWAVPTTGRYDEEEMGTAHPTNGAAIINDISAASAGDEAANIAATVCPEATSDTSPAANKPAAGANIRGIFSAGSTVQLDPWPEDRLAEMPATWETQECVAGGGGDY